MLSSPSLQAPVTVAAVGLDPLVVLQIRSIIAASELVLVPSTPEELQQSQPSDFGGRVLIGTRWPSDQALMHFCHTVRHAYQDSSRIVAIAGLPHARPNFHSGVFGVDEVIQRPFGGDLVRRLREAFTLASDQGQSLHVHGELQRALDTSQTGEVIVRAGSVSASIHVQEGHVVWAHLSTMPTSLQQLVEYAGIKLDNETVAAIIDESQKKGQHFAQVLISWGILEPASGRDALRRFIAERVKHILALPGASALFVPRSKRRQEAFRFQRSELFRTNEFASLASGPAEPVTADAEPSLPPIDALQKLLDEVRSTAGFIAGAIVERSSGASVLYFGDSIDVDVLWHQYSLLYSLGSDAEDTIATCGQLCFMMRAIRGAPLFVFATCALNEITVGLARTSLARLFSRERSNPQ